MNGKLMVFVLRVILFVMSKKLGIVFVVKAIFLLIFAWGSYHMHLKKDAHGSLSQDTQHREAELWELGNSIQWAGKCHAWAVIEIDKSEVGDG